VDSKSLPHYQVSTRQLKWNRNRRYTASLFAVLTEFAVKYLFMENFGNMAYIGNISGVVETKVSLREFRKDEDLQRKIKKIKHLIYLGS
jgi:hypothetical protein